MTVTSGASFRSCFDAAQILARNGSRAEADQLLSHLWSQGQSPLADEFRLFSAWIELKSFRAQLLVAQLLEKMVEGDPGTADFWSRRSLAEQAAVLDWLGQIRLLQGDRVGALDCLNRAASLGRDTSLVWRLLAGLVAERGDLRLSLRYLRRSLELFRQLGLKFLSGDDFELGSFSGEHPFGVSHDLESYLSTLLGITRVAKTQRNLKQVRDMVMEMIHQFPDEERLMKVRLLLDGYLVEQNLLTHNQQRVHRASLDAIR